MKHYGLKPFFCAAAVMLFAGTAQQAQGQAPAKKYRAYLVSNAHFDTQWRWDV